MENQTKIKVIIGLGNEGDEYQKTYHNIGAFVAARLCQEGVLPKNRFFLLHGFMNTIGIPVKRFLGKANAHPAEALIIHDETDLFIGEYKLSLGGGSAGHKGVHSVIENLGTEGFWRLRVGVRDPKEVIRRKAEAFVLQQWNAHEEEIFISVLEKAWRELREKNLL